MELVKVHFLIYCQEVIKDFSGEIVFRRGVSVASTAQEHHNLADISVINYILNGLPEYASLSKIINEYPSFMETTYV